MNPLRLAVGTLTAVRVPAPSSVAPPVPGRAMLLAPLVGVVPGGLAALTCLAAGWLGLGAWVQAALALAVLALATRGLHLDGLADYADGLAASYDRDRALSVMRSGDTGPAGMSAVLLVLLVQFAALAEVLSSSAVPDGLFYGGDAVGAAFSSVVALQFDPAGGLGPWAVLAAAVTGRLAVPLACLRGVPAARPEGLGALVGGSVSRTGFAAVLLLTTAALALACELTGAAWWHGVAAVLLATLTAAVVVRRAVTRFGGITGDVIGAAVELSTAAALIALALG